MIDSVRCRCSESIPTRSSAPALRQRSRGKVGRRENFVKIDTALDGELGDDSIVGNDGSDVLSGFDGNDTIDAGAGDDVLDGGFDLDSLIAGAGNDTVSGGADDGIARVMGNPWAAQSSPRSFFSCTCSIMSSARTSFFSVSLA
jgi:hypothetical protein